MRTNPLFARLFHKALNLESGSRPIGAVVAERDRSALEAAIAAAAARQRRHRAGRSRARRRRRAFRQLLCDRGRGRGARPGSRHRLHAGNHRAARAREQSHPTAEDGARRPARRRHRARLSTMCSPPSSWRRISCSTRTSRPIRPSATSCRSSRMPTGRRAWCGICSRSRASRRCARRCSISARS